VGPSKQILNKWVNNITILYPSQELTYCSESDRSTIFTLDGLNDADSRKYVPFWRFDDVVPFLEDHISKTPIFESGIDVFKPNVPNIETLKYYLQYRIDRNQNLHNDT